MPEHTFDLHVLRLLLAFILSQDQTHGFCVIQYDPHPMGVEGMIQKHTHVVTCVASCASLACLCADMRACAWGCVVYQRSHSSRRFPYGYLVTTSYQSHYLQSINNHVHWCPFWPAYGMMRCHTTHMYRSHGVWSRDGSHACLTMHAHNSISLCKSRSHYVTGGVYKA